MPFDPDASDLTVAVVGTGTMGRGIVQVSAQGGMRVIAYDEKPGAAQAAKDYIAKTLGGLVEKGRVPEADAKAAVDRIVVAKDMGDVGKANVVIEAIVEQLAAKQALFAKLEGVVGPEAILASNTSSIPITAIASQCKHPERVGGMHFFNPVPLMRLVEIIPGLKTAQWVTDAMMALGRRMTREPVLCTDSPAFLVNHVGRGFVPESQRILTENIAGAADIDRILTGRARIQDGAVRAGRHGGHRHPAQRDGIDLRAVLRRAGVCAHEPVRAARRGRAAGAQDRRRLVRATRTARRSMPPVPPAPSTQAQVRMGAAERASSRSCRRRCSSCSRRPAWRSRRRPSRVTMR